MRHHDWQLHFSTFVQTRAQMPFEWGRNDCCLFAADAVFAMTGIDHAAQLRGYRSALGAYRIVKARGGFRQIATDALGPPVAAVYAAIGDVLLLENAGRELLAICNGTNSLAPGNEGLAVLGMNTALAAWKV